MNRLLKRLDGEQTSHKMFASQHLELLQYVPRENGDKPADSSKVVSSDRHPG
ncbi:MAG: hypothetical protein U0930_09045 [Pirellulales bacterium]